MIKIDHIGIVITNTSKSRAFYQDILKCAVKDYYEDQRMLLTYLDLKGQTIELIEYKNEEQKNQKRPLGKIDHIAFLVKNLDDEIENLKNKNIEIIRGPIEMPSQKVLFFLGPDEERIELVEKF